MKSSAFTTSGLAVGAILTGGMLSGVIYLLAPTPNVSAVPLFDSTAFWALMAPLFAIMNPMVAVPFFATLTEGQTESQRNRLALHATVAVATTLVFAAVLGDEILELFAISIGSFRIAGGIIVLLMGLGLIRSTASQDDRAAAVDNSRSQAICPIAIPLLAGPGAIAAVIVYCNGASVTSDYASLAVVLIVMVAIVYTTLRVAVPVSRYLGEIGMSVASRLLGMMVVAIAIDMATTGIAMRFHQLMQ